MKIPAAEHPLWTLAIGVIGLAALALMLIFSYEQFDAFKDVRTMLVTAAGFAGPAFVKWFCKRLGGSEPEE